MEKLLSKNRLETLSDGVFAIIITIQVFDIKIPQNISLKGSIIEGVMSLFPQIISWIPSFFILIVVWLNHNRLFSKIEVVDTKFIILNCGFLLFVSLVPVPVSLIAKFFPDPVPLAIFGAWMSLTSVSLSLLRLYLSKSKTLVTNSEVRKSLLSGVKSSFIFGPILYLTGAGISFMNFFAGIIVFTIVPVYFLFSKETK
ncbi:MAG: DUF1211 domain-containing protein [Ignavibacteriaceae bacterium]|nr:DUF1211 domain-containing protein [Ignavibacteriaceae bacterium]